MEKDFGSWFPNGCTDWKSPNLNPYSGPFNFGQNTGLKHMNSCTNMVSANGNLSDFVFSGVPHGKASLPNEPRGWFYCLPRYRQAFAPVLNTVPKQILPTCLNENIGGPGDSNTGSGCPQKRFLVFDQSGDQTTLLFSSGIGAPVKHFPSWNPKPLGAFNLCKEKQGNRIDIVTPYVPVSNNKCEEESCEDDMQSEMHEDTEELNALLYSDDENDYSEDDEVTSTGHSPSSMTASNKQEWSKVSGEEVASSAGMSKRQKLSNGDYYVPSLMDTASSVKTSKFEAEEDAESCCGDGENHELEESGSLPPNKRLRKEKIRQTVSILQAIIPGGRDKDAIVVLDEAIDYLRSLKVKAIALGLDTL
ncbi:hypothetical protein RJ639_023703 [Escallonia herrerae]|uniref:BHLH domain-containing protein n=1 Tax=Escallonia herrerae TaxID=1293975 RepID=A0AA88UYP9_9ASTE|nr:hypothetical protein RJ639_023703 [Escallonia herrerae]